MTADGQTDDLFRVRHMASGLYVGVADLRGTAPDRTDAVHLRLGHRHDAVTTGRALAGKLGDVWIALTGDAGVEIEPADK